MVLTSSNKNCASLGGETSNNTQSGSTSEKEVLIGFAPIASQQLAPIGTPTLNSDFGADFRSHTKYVFFFQKLKGRVFIHLM